MTDDKQSQSTRRIGVGITPDAFQALELIKNRLGCSQGEALSRVLVKALAVLDQWELESKFKLAERPAVIESIEKNATDAALALLEPRLKALEKEVATLRRVAHGS